MKKILYIGVIILLSSCAKEPINQNEVNFLFRGFAANEGVDMHPAEKKLKDFVEEALPGITFNLVPITAPEGEYFTKVALALRNDSSYDIITEDSFILQSDVIAGLLAPLPVEDWDDWTEFFDSGVKASTVNGEVYTIPWNTDIRGIYYSYELFEKAGLPRNWQPKDWNDILEAARKIKALDPNSENSIPVAANISRISGEATIMQTFQMLLYGTEDPMFEDSKWIVDSKGLYDSLQFLQTLRKEDLVDPNQTLLSTTYWGGDMLKRALSGRVGIRFDGSWLTSGFINDGLPNWEEVYGFVPFPTQYGDPERPIISMSGGFGFSISAKSERKELAWKVIKVLASYDTLSQVYPVSGHLTTRKDIAVTEEHQKIGVNKQGAKIAPYSFYRPANNVYPAVSTEMQVMIENVVLGMDIKEAINIYAKNVEAIAGTDNVVHRQY